jgi:hypothetical protein
MSAPTPPTPNESRGPWSRRLPRLRPQRVCLRRCRDGGGAVPRLRGAGVHGCDRAPTRRGPGRGTQELRAARRSQAPGSGGLRSASSTTSTPTTRSDLDFTPRLDLSHRQRDRDRLKTPSSSREPLRRRWRIAGPGCLHCTDGPPSGSSLCEAPTADRPLCVVGRDRERPERPFRFTCPPTTGRNDRHRRPRHGDAEDGRAVISPLATWGACLESQKDASRRPGLSAPRVLAEFYWELVGGDHLRRRGLGEPP